MKKCLTSWNSAKTLAAFALLAEAIKLLRKKKSLLKRMILFFKNLKNKKIQRNLSLLTPKIKLTENKKNYDYDVRGKARYVDPKVLVNGSKIRLSTLIPSFKEEIKKFKQKVKAGHYIKII